MEETGDLDTRHGRLGFAVLLFQDLSAIPLIALAPLFAGAGSRRQRAEDGSARRLEGPRHHRRVVVVGHYLLDQFVRLVALTRVKEAMTAAALLTVVGVAILMQYAGLSASLGAFIAGALLAESSYRHQLEADIQPFEGLLLGLFFTAIGMTIDLRLLVDEPVVGPRRWWSGSIAVKTVVLYVLGRWEGLEPGPARRLGLALSQGGEFAFVLFTVGYAAGALTCETTELLSLVVTLSMATTPDPAEDRADAVAPQQGRLPAYDTPPDEGRSRHHRRLRPRRADRRRAS